MEQFYSMYKNEFSKTDQIEKINNSDSKQNIFICFIRILFSFEFLFALFLFAWAYKADPKFEWVPIDLTQLFFILSICSGIFVFLAEKKRFKKKATVIVFSCILFVVYVLISLTWTVSDIYAHQKALNFSILTLWTVIAGAFIIASDKVRLTRFIKLILLLAIWIAVESTIEYLSSRSSIINLNSNYLALGYTLGMGVLICTAYGLLSGGSQAKRILMIFLSLYFLFVLFILGGRGPLISTVISLSIPLLFRSKHVQSNKSKLKKYTTFVVILFLIIFLISLYLYSSGSLTATLYRMLLFLEPGMGQSAGTRIDYYLISEKLWLTKPVFGYGIGSWPILNGLPDANFYPHNMVMEILVELGLVGLFLLCLTVFLALKGFIKQNKKSNLFLGTVVLMLFMNAFIGAMFSGDINDNRILFLFLGLMAFRGNQIAKQDMYYDNRA